VPFYSEKLQYQVELAKKMEYDGPLETFDYGTLHQVREQLQGQEIMRNVNVELAQEVMMLPTTNEWLEKAEGVCTCHRVPREGNWCSHSLCAFQYLKIVPRAHPQWLVGTLLEVLDTRPLCSAPYDPLVKTTDLNMFHIYESVVLTRGS